jgi:hypothetical protein
LDAASMLAVVLPATKQVINGVQSILGYTELHPDVLAKIEFVSNKLEKFE